MTEDIQSNQPNLIKAALVSFQQINSANLVSSTLGVSISAKNVLAQWNCRNENKTMNEAGSVMNEGTQNFYFYLRRLLNQLYRDWRNEITGINK